MTKRKILYGYQIRGGSIGDRSGRAAGCSDAVRPLQCRSILPGHLRCVESAGRSIQLRNTALEQAKIKRMLENARYTGKMVIL